MISVLTKGTILLYDEMFLTGKKQRALYWWVHVFGKTLIKISMLSTCITFIMIETMFQNKER